MSVLQLSSGDYPPRVKAGGCVVISLGQFAGGVVLLALLPLLGRVDDSRWLVAAQFFSRSKRLIQCLTKFVSDPGSGSDLQIGSVGTDQMCELFPSDLSLRQQTARFLLRRGSAHRLGQGAGLEMLAAIAGVGPLS